MRLARWAALAAALALGAGAGLDAAEAARTTLAVEGMTCGGCVAAVKLQLKRTEGVTAYEVSLERAEAEVSYDPARTSPERIAESVSETGFKASVKKPAEADADERHGELRGIGAGLRGVSEGC